MTKPEPAQAISVSRTIAKPTLLRAISVSDVHNLRDNIDNPRMIRSFVDMVLHAAQYEQINTLLILGDWWDQLVNLSHANLADVFMGMVNVMRICSEYQIRIYVLRGTVSHDWEQNRLWVLFNTLGQCHADLVYVDRVSVLHDERFGLDYLFVPDDVHYDPAQVLRIAQQTMAEYGCEQVDFAWMHGMFDHQVPQGLSLPALKYADWAPLARHAFYIGHVHTSSAVDRAFANGSFGRCAHGEEEDKGCWLLWIDSNGRHQNRFIVNEHAEKFITVNCQGKTPREAMAEISEVVKKHGTVINVRIQAETTNPILQNLTELYTLFVGVRFTEPKRVNLTTQAKNQALTKRLAERVVPKSISRDNIGQLIVERARHSVQLDAPLMERLSNCIEQIR